MNDIFISYDRSNRAIAQKFADALEAFGWSVWWDREIPLGKSFDQVIEEELTAARCVLVLWSKESVLSRWVKTEAAAALDRDRLVPALIEETAIPLEFRRIQAAELWNWEGDTADPEFKRLIEAIQQALRQVEPAGRVVQEQARARPTVLPWWQASPRLLVVIAIAVIAVIASIALKNVFQSSNQTEPQATNSAGIPGNGAPASASTSPDAVRVTAPEGAFALKIGDRVTDGVPAPGAGSIEKPYAQDTYVFNAQPGQQVYFRMLRHSTGMDSIRWRLADEYGMNVFDSCLACGEPGVQTLTRGGAYTMTIGSDNDPAAGTYQVQLFTVPPPNKSSIKIGDVIQENSSGPGAGFIETPGAEDIYTFTAAPRQRVYFRMLGHSAGLGSIQWRLTDQNEMEVFRSCLDCSEPGVQTLVMGGTYTLTLGNRADPSTGTYRLQLFEVPPPNKFAIRIGDRIKPGSPGPGAGVIESPGAEDVYTFTATPGQKVSFHILEQSKDMSYIKWRLEDEIGMEVFNSCLGCTEPGLQTLIREGTYTLTLGHTANAATGSYGFEIGAR